MDEMITLSAQMEQNVSPVILINKFNVKSEDVDQLIKAWAADAAYFKQQPGFISAQLHRGIRGSCVFINYAVWESTQQFKEAFYRPDSNPSWEHILIAQRRLLIFSKKLQYQGFVLISNAQVYNIYSRSCQELTCSKPKTIGAMYRSYSQLVFHTSRFLPPEIMLLLFLCLCS